MQILTSLNTVIISGEGKTLRMHACLGALSHRQFQAVIASRQNSRVVPQGQLVEMLELYYGKLSRTVLRRESGSNARDLSGLNETIMMLPCYNNIINI